MITIRFYQKEIAYRRALHNPPFSRLARLVFNHPDNERCREEAERVKRLLMEERDSRGVSGVSLVGPAPAYIQRVRGKYRWQLFLRAPDPSSFLAEIPFPGGWVLDIDPVGTL
jgi:primosomal protein N' (replication factor Y)